MNILIVPMFALSRMGGPWSRAQAVAAACERADHHAVLAVSQDGNCLDPCVADTLELPVPSPLGLPMAVASRTFPLAEKLGISGRKPVRSFEEVLWLTGALAYDYERNSVEALANAIADRQIDAVYSEYSLPAIIAARAVGVPAFGSFSFTTQASFANAPAKANGVRKLLADLGLPAISSSLELFDWLEHRFVPSCHTLEPIDDAKTEFVGFLNERPASSSEKRSCVVVYLGSGSVPQRTVEQAVLGAFSDKGIDVYVAVACEEHTVGSVHFAPRFDFAQLLPHARCFMHHGGQNSTMDALAYATPQIIVPGKVFERIYNAESIARAGAGIVLDNLSTPTLEEAFSLIESNPSFEQASEALRIELSSLGGADAIIDRIEQTTRH